MIYKDAHMVEECFTALDQATLMYIRAGQDRKFRESIVRVNEIAANVAEEAEEHERAAEYYFRAADFAEDPNKRTELTVKAADELENAADTYEMVGDYPTTLKLLKKVGRIYLASGDTDLGTRILQRAARIAKRWAEKAKQRQNYDIAGTALAEAAQILQHEGNNIEAVRFMMDAAELYERAKLFEKAGNTYDAAQEMYKRERLTAARKKAMIKASEAYMQMEGKPEVVAPLLVKAGNMFTEVESPMKARWAFKRAAELFEDLAEKAENRGDMDSANKYLRYEAMCLKKWGDSEAANEVYKRVIDYYIKQAEEHEKRNLLETQAIALREASTVLYEIGQVDEARALLEQALELYIQLAEDATIRDEIDESSRLYSSAADCALRMGDIERHTSFHWVASEKAVIVAENYKKDGVSELATIWYRTAGREALQTMDDEMLKRAIDLLRQAVAGFREMGEQKEAFEDLFIIFETLWQSQDSNKEDIDRTLDEMQEIALSLDDEYMKTIVTTLRHLQRKESLEAQQTVHEHENVLGEKAEILLQMVGAQKKENRIAAE